MTPTVEPIAVAPALSRYWFWLIAVYFLLFLATGWVAFFHPQYNPAHADPAFLKDIGSATPQVRDFVLETLKRDADTFSKMHELARTAFNLMLGALVGFLSASGAQLIGKTR